MDPTNQILNNVRNVLGCNSVRNFGDIAVMRRETLESKLRVCRNKLSKWSTASIYAVWLTSQVVNTKSNERQAHIDAFAAFMHLVHLERRPVDLIWRHCQTMALDGTTNNTDSLAVQLRMQKAGDEIRQAMEAQMLPQIVKKEESTSSRAPSTVPPGPNLDQYSEPPRSSAQEKNNPNPSIPGISCKSNDDVAKPTRKQNPMWTVPASKPPTGVAQEKGSFTSKPFSTPTLLNNMGTPSNKILYPSRHAEIRANIGTSPLPSKPEYTANTLYPAPSLLEKQTASLPLKPADLQSKFSTVTQPKAAPPTREPAKVKNPNLQPLGGSNNVPSTHSHSLSSLQSKSKENIKPPADGVAPGGTSAKKLEESFKFNICGRCGKQGHKFADCPTSEDPIWDPRPPPSYKCRRCGVYGHHYTGGCQANVRGNVGQQKTQPLQGQDANKPQGLMTLEQDSQKNGKKQASGVTIHDIEARVDKLSAELQYIGTRQRELARDSKGKNGQPNKVTIKTEGGAVEYEVPWAGYSQKVADETQSLEMEEDTFAPGETRGHHVANLDAKSFLLELEDELQPTDMNASSLYFFDIKRDISSKRRKTSHMSDAVDVESYHYKNGDDDVMFIRASTPDSDVVFVTEVPSSPVTPERHPAIQFGVSSKPLYQVPPYSSAVLSLFQDRKNVWIRRDISRSDALSLWHKKESTEFITIVGADGSSEVKTAKLENAGEDSDAGEDRNLVATIECNLVEGGGTETKKPDDLQPAMPVASSQVADKAGDEVQRQDSKEIDSGDDDVHMEELESVEEGEVYESPGAKAEYAARHG